jgi:hypothetical protein
VNYCWQCGRPDCDCVPRATYSGEIELDPERHDDGDWTPSMDWDAWTQAEWEREVKRLNVEIPGLVISLRHLERKRDESREQAKLVEYPERTRFNVESARCDKRARELRHALKDAIRRRSFLVAGR